MAGLLEMLNEQKLKDTLSTPAPATQVKEEKKEDKKDDKEVKAPEQELEDPYAPA